MYTTPRIALAMFIMVFVGVGARIVGFETWETAQEIARK